MKYTLMSERLDYYQSWDLVVNNLLVLEKCDVAV